MDIVRGAYDKPVSTKRLVGNLEKIGLEGILYTGYPIIGLTDNKYSLDALLITPQLGVVLFDIVEEPEYSNRAEARDEIYNAMVSRLINVKGLSQSRGQLSFDLNIITYAPAWNAVDEDDVIVSDKQLEQFIQEGNSEKNADKYKKILEAIQAITKLKQKIVRKTANEASKGAILNELEKSIANLDKFQSKAVIETSDGIQRIRGLAGSGKTIILALKAAYLHSKFPEWKIGVTFYTRSLKSQFRDLITKFTIEHTNDEPDWSKIKIMQAWGSPSDDGFYYSFCKRNGVDYHNFDSARYKFKGDENLLEQICALATSSVEHPKPEFDVILIDEAQDFSSAFLRLCYHSLKESDPNNPANRRLVYAYDELQKLNEVTLPNPKEIFGSAIDFHEDKDKPDQDVILPVCYRNSAPVLVAAHGLGFGIYREVKKGNNLVTMFQETELWKDVGYTVIDGKLELGKSVELARDKKTSPELITQKVPINDLISFHKFNSAEDQNKWIANEIEKNLEEDELTFRDIIVIHPNAYYSKSETSPLRALLVKKGIKAHLAGVSTSRDDFFIDDSIAFTSIFRAKGNEAAMVYIMHTNYCWGGMELIKRRNTLFTAITRSKGWVRACGMGSGLDDLMEEFKQIKDNKFHLKFKYPTKEEMAQMNLIHRERSMEEKRTILRGTEDAESLLRKLENNEIQKEDLPSEIREKLKKLLDDSE